MPAPPLYATTSIGAASFAFLAAMAAVRMILSVRRSWPWSTFLPMPMPSLANWRRNAASACDVSGSDSFARMARSCAREVPSNSFEMLIARSTRELEEGSVWSAKRTGRGTSGCDALGKAGHAGDVRSVRLGRRLEVGSRLE